MIRRIVLLRAAGLFFAVCPAGLAGQWGDLRLEVGGFRAFATSGTNLDASTYLTAALQVDRWTPSGSGVFAGVFAGMATDSIGGDWGSMVLGGRAVAGSGEPVEFQLSGSAYGFVVAEPFAYEAYTVTVRPEIHIPVGRAAIVFYGEGGKGSSTIEFRQTDHVRAFDQDLWHYGGGPEVRLRLGRAMASVSAGVLETDAGTYHRGEIRLRTVSNGSLIDATLRIWGTPLGNETTGTVALTIPVGRSGWFARLVGGRTDPDPLVQSEPGGQGGLIVGRRLVRFGPTARTPIVRLDPMSGGATALFRVESARAQSVEVIGDFSSWEPQEMARDGRDWILEIPLTTGTYHFGFLVDGEWFVPAAAAGQVSTTGDRQTLPSWSREGGTQNDSRDENTEDYYAVGGYDRRCGAQPIGARPGSADQRSLFGGGGGRDPRLGGGGGPKRSPLHTALRQGA